MADPPTFITWLPGGLAKTRTAGHRLGRLRRTSGEHSWQKAKSAVLSLGWRHFYYHGHTDLRATGVGALRTNVPDCVEGPIYLSAFYVLGIIFCLVPAILTSRMMLND